MNYNKPFLFVVSMLFAIAVYSQQNFQSSHQKKCSWDTKTNAYHNCMAQQKTYKIEINTTKKIISITHQNEVYTYYIRSDEKSNGTTTFYVIEATGNSSTITLNLKKQIMEVVVPQPLTKEIFYLNK